MKLQNSKLAWSKMFTYLGVTFQAGKTLTVDNSSAIRKFYSGCNSIFHKTLNLDEIAKLHLVEANCLPFLTYALPALKLNREQLHEMNKAWNCAYRKIFGYHMWESVKQLMCCLGKLDFMHIRLKLYINFLRTNVNSNNLTLNYLLMRNVLFDSYSIFNQDSIIGDIKDLGFSEHSHGHVVRLIHESLMHP